MLNCIFNIIPFRQSYQRHDTVLCYLSDQTPWCSSKTLTLYFRFSSGCLSCFVFIMLLLSTLIFFIIIIFIYLFISLPFIFVGRASTDSSAADTHRHEPHHCVSRLSSRRLVPKTKTWVIWVQGHERYPSGFRGSDCCSGYCLCYQGILTTTYRNLPFMRRNTCMPIYLP